MGGGMSSPGGGGGSSGSPQAPPTAGRLPPEWMQAKLAQLDNLQVCLCVSLGVCLLASVAGWVLAGLRAAPL
jgi:hypothetical protein